MEGFMNKTLSLSLIAAIFLALALANVGTAQTLLPATGIIVKSPTLSGVSSSQAGSMNINATYVAIRSFPENSRLTATVIGTGQVLADGFVAAPGLFGGRGRRNIPYIYPLTTGTTGSPNSVPSTSQVSVSLTDPDGNQYAVSTASFLSGITQPDINALIITGVFDPTLSTSVYMGFWPFSFNAANVTVTTSQITVNLTHELIGGFSSGVYPVTVLNGAKCDSVTINFRSTLAGN
jgi:hypothetical protein